MLPEVGQAERHQIALGGPSTCAEAAAEIHRSSRSTGGRGLGELCVDSLLSMGFSRAVALKAWKRSGGDLARAVEEAIYLRKSPPEPSPSQRRRSLTGLPRAQLPFTAGSSPLERRHSHTPPPVSTPGELPSSEIYGYEFAAERPAEGSLTVDDIIHSVSVGLAGSEGDAFPSDAPTIEEIIDALRWEAESLGFEDDPSAMSGLISEHEYRQQAIEDLLHSVQAEAAHRPDQRDRRDWSASMPPDASGQGMIRSALWERCKQQHETGGVSRSQRGVEHAMGPCAFEGDAVYRGPFEGHGHIGAEIEQGGIGGCETSGDVLNVEDILNVVLSAEEGAHVVDEAISVDDIIRFLRSSPETADDEDGEHPPGETGPGHSVEDVLRSVQMDDREGGAQWAGLYADGHSARLYHGHPAAISAGEDRASSSPARTSASMQLHSVRIPTQQGQHASTVLRTPTQSDKGHFSGNQVASPHGPSSLPHDPSRPPAWLQAPDSPFMSVGPPVAPESPQTPDGGNQEGLGMQVAEKAGVGVIVTMMRKGGAAAAAEPFLQIGDRIISMDGHPVRAAADVALLGAGECGTNVSLHCSRISGRTETDASARSRVVSIISLVRGKPGEHTVKLYTRLEDGASLSDTQSWINAKRGDSISGPRDSPPKVSWSATSQSVGSPFRGIVDPGYDSPGVQGNVSLSHDLLGTATLVPGHSLAGEKDIGSLPNTGLTTHAMMEAFTGTKSVLSSWEAISSPSSRHVTENADSLSRVQRHATSSVSVPLAATNTSLRHTIDVRGRNFAPEQDRDVTFSRGSLRGREGGLMIHDFERASQKSAQRLQGQSKVPWQASASSSSVQRGPSGLPSADGVLGALSLQNTQGSKTDHVSRQDTGANCDAEYSRIVSQRAGEDGEVVPFSALTLMWPPMGTGSCKTVYQAHWRQQVVAAALVRHGEIGTEVRVLRKLPAHPFLPIYYGISRDERGDSWLITEFFPLGGLDTQLEVWEGWLSTGVKLCIVQQILEAMVQIHAMGVIHRDLATRNVLVHSLHAESAESVWVKVTDFGSAREGREVKGEEGEFVPWRWVSPEVHTDGVWSEASDVWAFGVTAWEVFSAALIPFCEISDDGELKRRVFEEGMRLQIPSGCPEWIYGVMTKCWAHIAYKRPRFVELKTVLEDRPSTGTVTL